jgi:replication fork protection complex subunit Tof1/Swi1
LKDLLRWLRLHDYKYKRFDVRRCLAHANIVKGDLLEILAQFPESGTESRLKSRTALGCLQLLTVLTDPLEDLLNEDDMTRNFHRHIPYLKLAQVGYKRALLHFENAEILRTVVRICLPAMAQPRAERSTNDKAIIGLVLNLVRNIAMITQPQDMPSQGDENEITRSTTIAVFSNQDIFNFLLTVGSGSGDEFQDNIVTQLEVLFHILKGIDPKKLFLEQQQIRKNNTKEFKDLLSKEKAMLNGYKKHAPTRHNRFGTMVWLKRDETNYSTVTGQHSITNDEQTLYHMDKSKKWDKPKFRGKKTEEPNEQLAIGERCEIDESATKILGSFVADFLDSSFNPLFLALRKLIERDSNFERHTAENVKQYFYLISWFLNAATARHESVAKENEKNPSDSTAAMAQDNSYAYIAAVLDQETFVLLNRSMQLYLDEKNWQTVQSTVLAFTQILLTVQSMAESPDEEDQEIAENIQNRIFYEEATHDRILQLLRGYKRQGFAYLDAVTECTHVFVRMLERYSKVNVDLQIRSKRRARRKQKQKQQPEGTEANPVAAEEEAEQAEDEERELYQAASERKFDFAKFSAKFMNQGCVDTFLSLLNFYNDLTPEQLKRCHRYFYRLAFKNELAVLLFRVDILLLFHRLIKGPEGLNPDIPGFKELEQLVQQVFRRCVKWVSRDTEGEGWKEMCMIEMLFSKMGNTVFYMQNGYDRVVEKATPRPPTELDFKANITEEQKVGVAVGVMLENNKAADVSWVREEVKRAADEREAFEIAHRHAMPEDADPDEWQATSTSPNIFLQPGDSAERKLALFKDKHLRLLLTAVGYQRLGVAEDTEASWILPGELSSTKLNDIATKIQQAEFDPPTFDGRSATDMIKPKGSYVRRETTSEPFGDASDVEEGASDADNDLDAPMFPPNLREKRKQAADDDEEAPKKKRRLQRRNAGEDPTDSDAERRAESRREKERERNERIKSKLFVTASDDESDAEGDAEFFRLEEERRQKMKGIIRNQLLAEMNEVGKGDGGKGKKAGKKEVRAKAKEVARALGEDEDDLVDGVLEGMDVGEDADADEDADDAVVDVPSSSPAPDPSSPGAMDIADNGDAAEKEAPIAIPDDDEDEDDAPVSKKPPARRLRAGFLDDSDSDE